jgi:FkbM family methyltransferase
MNFNSFSQYGEDVLLVGLLNRDGMDFTKGGFYMDVGAHHPKRFSNTKIFYDHGWNGINIDPNEGTKELFDLSRPRDKNFQVAVCDKKGIKEFFLYDEPALNSLNNRNNEIIQTQYSPKGSKKIEVDTIENILSKNLTGNLPYNNFLDIDVEGAELATLKGNNWSKFKFLFILIEQKECTVNTIKESEIYNYLQNVGYKPVAFNGITTIYKQKH